MVLTYEPIDFLFIVCYNIITNKKGRAIMKYSFEVIEYNEILALVQLTITLDEIYTIGAVEIVLGDKSIIPFMDIVITSLIAIHYIIKHEFLTAYRSIVECRYNILSNVFKFHYRN